MAASILGLTGCATTPPQIPDHPPATTHASEHVSQTAPDNAEANEFAMPTPGPFDPTAPGYKPFKPCEDIPDEVFERVGVVKAPDGGENTDPYFCPIVVEQTYVGEGFDLTSWQQPFQMLLDTGAFIDAVVPVGGVPKARVLKPHPDYGGGICFVGVETAVGVLGVTYSSFGAPGNERDTCIRTIELFSKFYIGE
ncbi:DUF3558 family protein [Corynebacterium lizhenjunii]|uniref:DUF3558 family protein n=1 Tax=Corynebacterium lizhenjunii TaxID=2709394 RepID=A0A7T0KG76_9CORY|nr:DUF3558 family protein [Corynebacterium lizhenjunii]